MERHLWKEVKKVYFCFDFVRSLNKKKPPTTLCNGQTYANMTNTQATHGSADLLIFKTKVPLQWSNPVVRGF